MSSNNILSTQQKECRISEILSIEITKFDKVEDVSFLWLFVDDL